MASIAKYRFFEHFIYGSTKDSTQCNLFVEFILFETNLFVEFTLSPKADACNAEILELREKSSELKKKVRKAVDEEKQERAKITILDKEILELEAELARKLHKLASVSAKKSEVDGNVE